MAERLIVRGAQEHNLKGVDIDLPRDKMIVFTAFRAQVSLRWLLTRFSRRPAAVRGILEFLCPYVLGAHG